MMSGWIEVLISYEFKLFHRPGVVNVLPDHLSRLFQEFDAPVADPSSVPSSTRFIHEQKLPLPILPLAQITAAIEHSHLQGHFGVKAVVRQLIHQGLSLYWPGIRKDVDLAIK